LKPRAVQTAPIVVVCFFHFSWLITPSSALAADFLPTLTQYAHASWRVQDGEIGGQVAAITQTQDGYLWIGTAAGLERYDGTRFRHWALPVEKPVYTVRAVRDGSLWVGQTNAVLNIKGGAVTSSLSAKGRFDGILQDSAGKIWLARSRGPARSGALCEIDDAALRCFGAAEHQPCAYAGAIAQDAAGEIWIASASGACRWRPGAGSVVGPQTDAANNFGVDAFAPEPGGGMLVGFLQPGRHRGLQQVSEQGAQPFMAEGLNGETLQVSALLRDRQGALWIGTENAGIYHVNRGKVDRFTSADGLSGTSVYAFFEDREGDVWAATSGGVDRFHEHLVSAVTTRQGLSDDQVGSVLALRDGSIAMSTDDGLDILQNGVIRHIRTAQGLPGHATTSMIEDSTGKLWVGVDDDLTSYDGKVFHVVRKPDGSKLGTIVDLVEDSQHDIWILSVGRPYRMYRIRKNTYLDEVFLPNNQNPYLMSLGFDGTIWIFDLEAHLFAYKDGRYTSISSPGLGKGYQHLVALKSGAVVLSSRQGAYYLNRGRWLLLNKAHGLPCDSINSVTEVHQDALWLRGQCGLMIVAKPDLDRVLDHPQERLKVRLLDAADGAQPGEPSFSPAVTTSPSGRLWFATDGVVLTADPASLPINALAPPVHVEQVVADHRTYAVAKAISFPPRTRDLEIDYAGLSLVAPQKVRFRYRLLGVDDEWQDVGIRRAAFYMNLKPGRHQFQVIASNNDGVWNRVGDTFNFSIRPAYYQTLWFQALAVALAVAMVWFGLWLRVRYVAAEIETRLSERQAERMRIARELHDTLLQGFQGLLMRFQVVADAIPQHSPAKPMMDAVLSRAEDVLVEGRERVSDLRSAETGELPLFDELQNLASAVEQDESALIEVRLAGKSRVLKSDVQREIVAIAREALVNACRHSAATRITCQLAFTRFHVRLVCEDNGIGIEGATMKAGGRDDHWGLTGMRERARQIGGALRIQSEPGCTRVEFRLNTSIAGFHAIAAQMSGRTVN
jgi:signal transduction histidine kinase/ligand-binding sensor domain-containing protein